MTADTIISLVTYFGIPCVLLLVGWLAGRAAERVHFRRLDQGEAEFADVVVTDLRRFTPAADASVGAAMVTAEVVIATDYLKSFLAGLRNIFGGEVRSYESLLRRARREAILRLREQARRMGCDAVCNIRMESADVGGSSNSRKGAAMVAVLAWGTAYRTAGPGNA